MSDRGGSVQELIAELRSRTVRLERVSDGLRVRAPRGALTPELRAWIARARTDLIAHLDRTGAAGTAADEPFALTDLQHAYWVGESGAYELSTPGFIAFSGDVAELDVARLTRALHTVVRRHPMLRAVVRPDGTQHVRADAVPVPRRIDLSDESPEAAEERWREHRNAITAVLPDLAEGPALACLVVRMPRGVHRVTFALRLFAVDARSAGVVMAEIGSLYRFPGTPPPEAAGDFRDYVRSRRPSPADREYWRRQAAELPGPPLLPAGSAAPAVSDSAFQRISWTLDRERTARLTGRARSRGLTLSAALCTAFASVLFRWCGQEALTLNTLVTDRPQDPRFANTVGNFGSTQLLAVQASEEPFSAQARRLQHRMHENFAHRSVSGVEVLRRLRQDAPDRAALMPIVFTSSFGLGTDAQTDPLPGWRPVESELHTPQVTIDHQVYPVDGGDGIGFNVDHVAAAHPEGMIDELVAAYRARLEALSGPEDLWDAPAETAAALPPALSAARDAANDTRRAQRPRPLHADFDRVRHEHADRPAVICGERTLTYRELWAAATEAAAGLAAAGVRPGDLVAVHVHRGWRQVAAVLAVLYARAAYLPVPTTLPPLRVRRILEHSAARAVLADRAPDLPGGRLPAPVLLVDDLLPAAPTGRPTPVTAAPDSLAYVIYTSGTTGEPKGVAMEHAAVVNTLDDVCRRFGVTAQDRLFQLSSLGFDLSVFDIFAALSKGAAVVLPEETATPDPHHWARCVAEHGVTVWNSVPALLEMALEALGDAAARTSLRSLRLVMLSGDWIPLSLPDRVRGTLPRAHVMSLGGATEAAIWSNFHPADGVPSGWPSIPYGRPLANQGFRVLDRNLADAPTWVPGDLYITGAGLARGYHRAPETTARAFVRHPRTGQRMYRTGDRARYRPSGDLEFLGRADTQVKIRGHRIELGEIDAALLEHPGVRACVALDVGERSATRRIVAFHVPADGRRPTPEELRAHTAERLAPYMVPSAFVALDAVPTTANGKVDRAALRALAGSAGGRREQPPGPGVEETVAGIWAEVLGQPVTDRDADFFEHGGTSLLAVRLLNRLNSAFGVDLGLGALFSAATPRQQARLIGEAPLSDPVCLMRDTPGRPALVLLHPVGGGVLCYRDLLRALPADLHVLGVQSPPPDGRRSVTELADHYAAKLAAALPDTPVTVAGWSMGGVLALEVADRLSDTGRPVRGAVAIDSYASPDPDPGRAQRFGGAQALTGFLTDLYGGRLPDGAAAALADLARTGVPDSAEEALAAAVGSTDLADRFRGYLANYRALLAHRPRPAAVPTLLVGCSRRDAVGFPLLEPLDSMEWTATAPVRVVRIDADHFSVVQERAAEVARALVAVAAEEEQ